MRVHLVLRAWLFVLSVNISVAQSVPSNSLLIRPGDNLHVSVLDMPDMEQFARVTDSGEVPIQGVGNVKVANMTPAEAADAIHDRFLSSRFLNHPVVSVVVDQYATQQVTVVGEIKSPGAYPTATPRPILDVIALGGGLTEYADRDILVERYGDKANPVHYYVSNDGEQAIRSQVVVNPGDTVVIPKAGIVYVLGDVTRRVGTL